jgi:UrcA family protein
MTLAVSDLNLTTPAGRIAALQRISLLAHRLCAQFHNAARVGVDCVRAATAMRIRSCSSYGADA